MRRDLVRMLRAQWRDTRVLLSESRGALLLFGFVLLAGSLLLHFFYLDSDTGARLPWGRALYAAFSLVFFETVIPFPDPWYLRMLFFLIPILGLAAIGDGLLHFGSALVNKRERGQKWQVAMASTYSGHVIVCGLGKLGYRVILELLRFDREVVGVERNASGRFLEKVQALGVPVILADARMEESLIKAGVARADAIIPATDDELTNVDIALDARELNPRIKVVLRMFDPDLARRVEHGFGIHTAFSTSALAAPLFAAAAMRIKTRYAFYVGEALLNLSQVTIDPCSSLIGWSVAKLEHDLDLTVVSHERGEATDLHPDPGLALQAGDRITVIATVDELKRLDDLNCTGVEDA